jgi:DNA-binding response OmpR family regulator
MPAANGVQALKLASTTKFDLALLDLNLSVTEGWKIFEQISAKNPLLPIILITARPNHFFHALASGVSGLLERPLDFVKLFNTIRNLLLAPSPARMARFTGQPGMSSHLSTGSDFE